jgi:hypothetical protein
MSKMRFPLSLFLLADCTHALQAPMQAPRIQRARRTAAPCLFSTRDSSSGIVLGGDSARSKLASAFAALAENDQYDAVLTGLCAKILDETPNAQCLSALQDPISLLQEMNGRRVAASGRSLMALIDVSTELHSTRSAPCTLFSVSVGWNKTDRQPCW